MHLRLNLEGVIAGHIHATPPATWHKGCWIPGERCSAYVFRGPPLFI
ncbi:hypothetical protein KP13_31953 [Klebsiella pneumoniae subsp. pneumoniae Kp13]|nr:hypothetical protein KP13_31953 [Klebsiella pneumoniae subsp. pneumoniae Kp13]